MWGKLPNWRVKMKMIKKVTHKLISGGPRSCFTVGKLFLTNDEVSPLDETALARQFRFSALRD